MKASMLSVSLLLFPFAATHGQSLHRLEAKAIEPVAMKSMGVLAELVNSRNLEQMGFESVEEVRSAQLGVPLKEYLVTLAALREFEPSTPPNALLGDTGHVAYPVKVGDRVRSSITLANVNGEWKPVAFGDANLHRLYARTRDENVRSTKLQKSEYFIVRIPGLNLAFLGYEEEEGLMLVPILDDSAHGMRAGESVLARDTFLALREAARQHDGLPR